MVASDAMTRTLMTCSFLKSSGSSDTSGDASLVVQRTKPVKNRDKTRIIHVLNPETNRSVAEPRASPALRPLNTVVVITKSFQINVVFMNNAIDSVRPYNFMSLSAVLSLAS